ncbi:MAG: lipopolysaccharide assembly protein LapA domain-containing protein [Rhodospirillales bacterium]
MGRLLYWIAVIPLFLVVIVFSVTNHASTELSLWPALTEPVPFPVYGIALVALFIGFVWGGIISWFQNGNSRRRIRELRRQNEADQRRSCCCATVWPAAGGRAAGDHSAAAGRAARPAGAGRTAPAPVADR